jgi:hypothetical protein
MNRLRSLHSIFLAALVYVMSVGLTSCSSDDDDQTGGGRGTAPAVMLSLISSNPDVRTTYVGAFSSVPTGNVSNSNMLEFGDAYYYAFDGSIFVWERDAVLITRYEVSDDLKLTKGKSISLINYGFKYGADLSFISPTKAIMMVSEQNKVIIWDPSTMEVTTDFPANVPAKAGFDVYPAPLGASGNYMYYSLFYSNYDDLKIYPNATIAAVPTDGTKEVKVFETTKTLPGITGYVDNAGDVYLIGDSDASVYSIYSTEGAGYPPAGIVRVKSGQTAFDNAYFFNLETITGSQGLVGNWKIDNDNILCRVWDPADEFPKTFSDFYGGNKFISKKVNIKTGEASDFPSLAKGGFSSNIQDFVNNVTYTSIPAADGSADVVYGIRTTGVSEAFRIPSAGYWGMKQIR